MREVIGGDVVTGVVEAGAVIADAVAEEEEVVVGVVVEEVVTGDAAVMAEVVAGGLVADIAIGDAAKGDAVRGLEYRLDIRSPLGVFGLYFSAWERALASASSSTFEGVDGGREAWRGVGAGGGNLQINDVSKRYPLIDRHGNLLFRLVILTLALNIHSRSITRGGNAG